MRIVSVFLTLVLAASIALAQEAVPPPPQPAADKPAASGPSLEVTMQFIQDKVNEQGKIVYRETFFDSATGERSGGMYLSQDSQVVAVDPAGGLSLQESAESPPPGVTVNVTATWHVYFKDVKKLEILNSSDYKHRGNLYVVYQDDPPYFELVIHLAAGKTVQRHTHTIIGGKHSKTTEVDDNIGEFALHFRDEEMANRVAKAMVHAVELCGGGPKPEPF